MYAVAEMLHMTVDELLNGAKTPISNSEFVKWMAYLKIKSEREKAEQDKAKAGRGR